MTAWWAPNLSDMLSRSEYFWSSDDSWLTSFPRSRGMFSCGHCQICHFSEVFTNADNTKIYKIKSLNCATTKVIYSLQCPCNKIYIGKTERQLWVPIGEHLRGVKHKELKSPLAQHFLLHHKSKPDGLRVRGINALQHSKREGDFDRVLLQKEKFWIYKLNAMIPNRLNR